MKNILMCTILGVGLMALNFPVLAEDVSIILPEQETSNTKSYTGINYNRQDSNQVGRQKIINDHSWFNININIIKEGALFKKESNDEVEN